VRRRSFLLVALALFGAAIVGTAGAREAAKPRLLLLDSDPVMFRGVGFEASERVQLTATDGDHAVRRAATSSSNGTFTMLVPGVDANDCEGFSAIATGNKSSRAYYKRAPGQCPIWQDGSG
jgi:hypothetical protein